MNEIKHTILWTVVSLVLLLGVVWAVQGSNFFLYKMFAARQEAVRREVFEESKAYNDGMVQELSAMQFEYVKAAPSHKEALAAIILHRVANYDLDRLPLHLRQFVTQLRQDRLQGVQP